MIDARIHSSVTQARVSQEKLAQIPCPNLRTLVNEGWLTPDADGLVELKQLDEALRRLGVAGIAKKTLVDGAQRATKAAVEEQLGAMASGKFNVYKLTGSRLDHAGDTRILRGGFDKERLDWLLSFANADGRLGIAELARAQKEARNDEPAGLLAKALGVAELVALLRVYGTPDRSGRSSISVDGVRDLYERARFPDEWRARLQQSDGSKSVSPQRTNLVRLLTGVIGMAFRQIGTTSGRAHLGIDNALGRDGQLNQTSAMGLGQSMCPAGPPTALPKAQAESAHGAAGG
jgi:hypothetical protein